MIVGMSPVSNIELQASPLQIVKHNLWWGLIFLFYFIYVFSTEELFYNATS